MGVLSFHLSIYTLSNIYPFFYEQTDICSPVRFSDFHCWKLIYSWEIGHNLKSGPIFQVCIPRRNNSTYKKDPPSKNKQKYIHTRSFFFFSLLHLRDATNCTKAHTIEWCLFDAKAVWTNMSWHVGVGTKKDRHNDVSLTGESITNMYKSIVVQRSTLRIHKYVCILGGLKY